MNEPKLRIVIADDHPIFRAGLRQLLETEADYEVVGEAADGVQAVDVVAESRPDLLLLDYSMPRSNGLDVLRELDRRSLRTRTVILTADIESEQVVQSLKLGAVGVLLKSAATDLLFRCIGAVMAGEYWVDRGTTSNLVSALLRYETAYTGRVRAAVELTSRERQIITALLKGESNKQIAIELGVAEQTVKNHLTQLYEKLGVSTRLELGLVARERNLGTERAE
jgi:two-component system, NarL family, nitrate/nitrite response regulator NarL